MPPQGEFGGLYEDVRGYLSNRPSSVSTPETIYRRINQFLNRTMSDEATALQKDWIRDFFYEISWRYVQSNRARLGALFDYLGGWDACLYSDPIADICTLVGSLIEKELDDIEHESRVLRILILSFADMNDYYLERTLLKGAAACMCQISKPVAEHLATKTWHMGALGLGMTEYVTPMDWAAWTARMEAFGDENQAHHQRHTRRAAREAANIMRLP
ncbi:hypothetical protein F5Y03DRAFT_338628 [Xylaria venustula]|nr:hypothetical protein F5Y03DRAFT_338628 [Xylaria venustula]